MKLKTAYSYLVKPGKKAAKSEDENAPKVKGRKYRFQKIPRSHHCSKLRLIILEANATLNLCLHRRINRTPVAH